MPTTTPPKKETPKEAPREDEAPLHPGSRLLYFTGMTVSDFMGTLKLGVNFGFPGKGGKYKVEGDITYERVGGQWRPVDDAQYKIRPSVYEPTARRILAAARLRPVCEVDVPTWEMMGSPASVLVYRCGIATLESSIEVAEGRGAVRVGEENLGVHLGPKRAMVCATMAAFPELQESFAAEEFVALSFGGGSSPPPHPARAAPPPVAAARAPRAALKALIERWKKEHADEDKAAFNLWAQNILHTKDNMFNPASWTPERLNVAGLQIGGGKG